MVAKEETMSISLNLNKVKGFCAGVVVMWVLNSLLATPPVSPNLVETTSKQCTEPAVASPTQQAASDIACPKCTMPDCPVCPTMPDCPVCPSLYDPQRKVSMTELVKRDYDVSKYHNPRIIQAKSLFSKEECERIIQLAKEQGLSSAVVVNPDKDKNGVKKVQVGKIQNRRSRTTGLYRGAEGNFSWVYSRILHAVNHNNDQFWNERIPQNFYSDLMENIQFGMYEASDLGHYNWHSDVGVVGKIAKRRLSAVLMLSPRDTYEGGMFQIRTTDEEIDVILEQGSLAIFPSYVLHRVTETTGGVRYSLASWVQTE